MESTNKNDETITLQDKCREKNLKILDSLFSNSFSKNGFGTLCTLLRVSGIENHYNAFEESKIAFNDFNWIVAKAIEERGIKCQRRVGLLMYCQAVEMAVPHRILANLLRCLLGQGYVIDPFAELYKSKGKSNKDRTFIFKSDLIPPSAKTKFRKIKELAKESGQLDLEKAIGLFFNEKVRNAFSHSDYTLSDTHFCEISVEDLDNLICECFGFYEAFFITYNSWLKGLAKGNRFHKWPYFQVLELLSSKEEGVYGFHVHFSNGGKSTYIRRESGIDAINFIIEKNGHIELLSNSSGKFCQKWKINGKEVKDWDEIQKADLLGTTRDE
jgi:hypothetical protein